MTTALGGSVEASPRPEIGWVEVDTDDPSWWDRPLVPVALRPLRPAARSRGGGPQRRVRAGVPGRPQPGGAVPPGGHHGDSA
ncbi:hypothetical protein ACFSUJ_34630 [Streptomyces lusitanus]|uniref:hypothetical protein n=1 Tax=Streptomyces lusitanus TaxID=68232 RepID=UPI00363ED194